MEIDITRFLINMGVAALAGLVFGLERQAKDKPAGLKTNMLVALGSCAFVIVCTQFKDLVGTDMTRIVGQVVVGVGFLGAGVILHKENETSVRGLATAATIWCCAGAGCIAAFGLYLHLLVFTAMVVVINLFFGYLNSRIKQHKKNSD